MGLVEDQTVGRLQKEITFLKEVLAMKSKGSDGELSKQMIRLQEENLRLKSLVHQSNEADRMGQPASLQQTPYKQNQYFSPEQSQNLSSDAKQRTARSQMHMHNMMKGGNSRSQSVEMDSSLPQLPPR